MEYITELVAMRAQLYAVLNDSVAHGSYLQPTGGKPAGGYSTWAEEGKPVPAGPVSPFTYVGEE